MLPYIILSGHQTFRIGSRFMPWYDFRWSLLLIRVYLHPSYAKIEWKLLRSRYCLSNCARLKHSGSSECPVVSSCFLAFFLERMEYLCPFKDKVSSTRIFFNLFIRLSWFYSCQITWTGMRKLKNVFEEFPSRNVHFVSILRVIACHASNNKNDRAPN